MKENYSIKEILKAVNDLQNNKKDKKIESKKINLFQKDYSAVPQNTLNLIKEAEDTKK
jgi:hypothetical protein